MANVGKFGLVGHGKDVVYHDGKVVHTHLVPAANVDKKILGDLNTVGVST